MSFSLQISQELVDRLCKIDLKSLTEECTEIMVLPQNVKKSFDSLDSKLPRKIRYFLLHAYERLEGNPVLFERWLEVLAKFGVTISADTDGPELTAPLLMKEHVPDLTEMLADNSTQWYDIGVALKLPVNALKAIAAQMPLQAGNKFIFGLYEVLNEWISMSYEHAKSPTVENLKTALRSKIVNLGAVANGLEKSLSKHGICLAVKRPKPLPKQPRSNAPRLEIVRQSFDVNVAEEKSTLLEVQAETVSGAVISYQWVKDDCPLKEDDAYFIGANKSILCVNNVITASKGTYVCQVKIPTESEEPIVVSSKPIALTVNFDRTTKVLVEVYSSALREIQINSWPPPSNKTYIELALVEHVEVDQGELATITGDIDVIKKEREKHIKYATVFGDYRCGSLILIEGRPGSGKTTLVNKITNDWACGKFILKGAKLVLLISLRALSNNVNASMLDILKSVYHTSDQMCGDLLAQLEGCFGRGVCLILDGLDEYSCENKYESTIFSIIQRKYLQESMVIVASRHAASGELRKTANICLEVVGFLKEQILEYVDNYPFTSKFLSAEDLKSYLNEHPHILHMCYLPVHASMISFLYSQIKNDLPETESGIYKYFTLFTLLRKLKGIDKLESLDDLTGKAKEQFRRICKLAFSMTTQSKQVFKEDELTSFDGSGTPDECSLGLVTIDISAGMYKMKNLYSFFHLTFQEFLAAYHISQLEAVEQMAAISKYGTKKEMMVVWKFLCGLVNHSDGLDLKFQEILKLYDDDLFRCNCAFESQHPSTCKSVILHGERGALAINDQVMSLSDFHSIGYVLSNASDIIHSLRLHSCGIRDDSLLLACANILKLCPGIKNLDLSANQFGDMGATMLSYCFTKYKNLLKLNLSENKVGPEGSTALADGLKDCNSLTSLNLEGNPIRDEGIQTLSKIVMQCDNLQDLNIAFQSISDSGSEPVAQILNNCKGLQFFNVAGNDFGSAGVETLLDSIQCCKNLRSLNLEWIKVDNHSAMILSSSLKANSCSHLELLSFKGADMFDSGILAVSDCLKVCTHLRQLNLDLCNVSDAGAAALASGLNFCSVTLERVELPWNKIGNEGAKALAKALKTCEQLKRLNLSENFITSSGVKSIVERLPLEVTYFYGNTVGLEGSRAIANNLKERGSNLKELHLNNCHMTSESAVFIAEGLQYCSSTLELLNVQQNNINDIGAEAIAKVMTMCTSLRLLDLSYNRVSDLGAILLAKSLSNSNSLEALHLGHNQISNRGASGLAESLKNCRKLQALSLPNNQIGNEGIEDISKNLTFLKKLDLENNEITGGSSIKALTKIVNSDTATVNLRGNRLDISSMKLLSQSLKHHSNMKELNLDCTKMGNDGAVLLAENLKHCKILNKLSLAGNLIGDAGVSALSQGLKFSYNLTKLILKNNLIGNEGANALAEGLKYCDELEVLHLANNQIGDDGVKSFGLILHHCTKLQEVWLNNNTIGSRGVKGFTEDLKKCNCLKKLNLCHNKIGNDGVKSLVEGLKNCCMYTTLDLAHNQISNSGAKECADILKCCCILRHVHLGNNLIGDDGAEGLAEGLKQCAKLYVLSLEHNNIGDNGAKALSEGLKSCDLLWNLSLDANQIGDSGTIELAEFLKSSPKLRTLRLSQNKIGEHGAKALAEGLEKYTNLEVLDLSHNEIGDTGLTLLVQNIKYCSKIEQLNFEGNGISDVSAEVLVENLKKCDSLWQLSLKGNSFSNDIAKYISEGLSNCSELTI